MVFDTKYDFLVGVSSCGTNFYHGVLHNVVLKSHSGRVVLLLFLYNDLVIRSKAQEEEMKV